MLEKVSLLGPKGYFAIAQCTAKIIAICILILCKQVPMSKIDQ